MNYRPAVTRGLWDTWIFPWEGKYHLFYLETQDILWDHIGRAFSDDLVNWQPLPSIPTRRDDEGWPMPHSLTGMTVHRDGKFYMFIGGSEDSQQVVGCFVSDDLKEWRVHPASPVMEPKTPYWSKPAPGEIDWRDPCIVQDKDGLYHAFLCARTHAPNPDNTGAAIAHLTSSDLINWSHRAPVAELGDRFFHTEVPDVFELDGRYYMCFCTITMGGTRIVTPSREGVSGTFYMIGDSLEGPYRLPDDPLLIGEGRGKMAAYVGRTIATDAGRVLYHHIQSACPALGLPKLVKANPDGTLYLQYMPVVENLRTGVVCDGLTSELLANASNKLGDWNLENGTFAGRANVMSGYCSVSREFIHGDVSCTVNSSTAARAGLVIRAKNGRGIGVVLDLECQRMLLAMVDREPGYGWGTSFATIVAATGEILHETCKMNLAEEKDYNLHCIVRDEFVEVYLDNRWVFTSVIKNEQPAGDVELWVERGAAKFSALIVANWVSVDSMN